MTSRSTRPRPTLPDRESCLAVPASNERMIEKAARSDAHMVFLDLEDACAPSEKQAARGIAARAFNELDFGDKVRAVRINDVTTTLAYHDLIDIVTVAGHAVDCIVLPKVESAAQVHFVDTLLDALEAEIGRETRILLDLQIESAAGAVHLGEIAVASDRAYGLVFGPGDYAVDLGIARAEIGMADPRYPGHQWHWVMSAIANHAHALGLHAIDGPYVDFHDESGYREVSTWARLLGFTGKWCIHPNQIEWVNEVFGVDPDELDRARRILAHYEASTSDGHGAAVFEGVMIDEATRKGAAELVARGSRQRPRRGTLNEL
jgi:citrate lyase subunit beta / citryl-CoA lyase